MFGKIVVHQLHKIISIPTRVVQEWFLAFQIKASGINLVIVTIVSFASDQMLRAVSSSIGNVFFGFFYFWGIYSSSPLKLFLIDYHMSRGSHWFWLQQLIFQFSLKFSLLTKFLRLYMPVFIWGQFWRKNHLRKLKMCQSGLYFPNWWPTGSSGGSFVAFWWFVGFLVAI